jgi:hypothetical protein
MIDKLWNIIFKVQAIQLLAPIYRSVSLSALVQSLVHPMDDLVPDAKDKFVYQRNRARFTGQKIVMQAALNFLNNITAAPFILVTTVRTQNDTIYLYDESNATQSFIYDETDLNITYFRDESESFAPGTFDFIVWIPAVRYTAELEEKVKAEVENMKLPGKKFNIIQY